ncbi:amino acid-binding protein [Limisphaera sp. VF-2]|jgi:hypothetical protein|uniref:amino acid-binding protein n=1 Tax=Limisphaera sp. VF-2 TaxID=3400418 RepID=UPI001756701A|nr:ACT domain-containing protein [Limisphaera sp.]
MKVQRADVWAAEIEDKPGALAAKLQALAAAGCNLEFVLARRQPDKPGTGVVFVTPIKGPKRVRAAEAAGFKKADSLHALRLEGADKPGQGARITQTLADQGLNLRGFSGAAIGRKFVCHLAFDTDEDAAKALKALKSLRG